MANIKFDQSRICSSLTRAHPVLTGRASRSVVITISLLLATSAFAIGDAIEFVPRAEIPFFPDPGAGTDIGTFLGNPNLNAGRTKDAHVADVNQDGWPDILDANSGDPTGGGPATIVLRLNLQGQGFDAIEISGGNALVTYDADLIDLDGDNLPELVRAETTFLANPGARRLAIYRNQGGVGGVWFDLDAPDFVHPAVLCPDDIAIGDLNGDGRVDLALSQRRFTCGVAADTSITSILVRSGSGIDFIHTQDLSAPSGISTHDVFFLDADNDGDVDVVAVNEDFVGQTHFSRLFLNDGAATPNFQPSIETTALPSAFSGSAADLNGDSYPDFVLGASNSISVFLNNSPTPGAFVEIPNAIDAGALGSIYDIELGDVDRDGSVDIVAAALTGQRVALWLNDGLPAPSFVSRNEGGTFPMQPFAQRLSADLIDFDRDGDLDLYAAGPDSGPRPNELYELITQPVSDVDGDGISDAKDNCIDSPNSGQFDADLDGFGNACDADFNQDGDIDSDDLATGNSCFQIGTLPTSSGPAEDPTCEESDANGDGLIDEVDGSIIIAQAGGTPGNSGLACADATGATAPCFVPHGRGDTDGDTIANFRDNCVLVPNGPSDAFSSDDTDLDGIGNACDGDYDQDGDVDSSDFGPFFTCFLIGSLPTDQGSFADATCERSDADADGDVDSSDFGAFFTRFLAGTTGESGLDCAGRPVCMPF